MSVGHTALQVFLIVELWDVITLVFDILDPLQSATSLLGLGSQTFLAHLFIVDRSTVVPLIEVDLDHTVPPTGDYGVVLTSVANERNLALERVVLV